MITATTNINGTAVSVPTHENVRAFSKHKVIDVIPIYM